MMARKIVSELVGVVAAAVRRIWDEEGKDTEVHLVVWASRKMALEIRDAAAVDEEIRRVLDLLPPIYGSDKVDNAIVRVERLHPPEPMLTRARPSTRTPAGLS